MSNCRLLCILSLSRIGYAPVYSYVNIPHPIPSVRSTADLATSMLLKPMHMTNDENEEDDEMFLDEMTRSLFEGGIPTNPFAPGGLASSRRPSTGDLYNEEELMNVLNAHKSLGDARAEQDFPSGPSALEEIGASSSLHDLVMQTIDVVGNDMSSQSDLPLSVANNSWMDDATRETVSNIRAIATDIDGTLLTSRQTIHPRTRQAIRQAVTMSSSQIDGELQWFFPATGKSRKGAIDSLGIEIGSLVSQVPGVFLQGLYCVDSCGNVIYEQKLSKEATRACEKIVIEARVSAVAFDGDDLYSTKLTDPVIELHERYGEPMPQLIGSLTEHTMHKILVMDNDVEKLKALRPKLEELAQDCGACVTQALPTMLEWLPAGCSKARGVAELCKSMGIDPHKQLLAIGDAENDATMLEMAAIGVAVGNGCAAAKKAADFVLQETNDEGGAGCAMEVFCFDQSWQ